MSDLKLNTPDAIGANVQASVTRQMGGQADYVFADTQSAGGAFGPGGAIADMLGDLMRVLQQLANLLGGDGGGNAAPTPQPPASVSTPPSGGEVIAGSGRIWGDPHFIGQDGGRYDVQGEAGKTYNLLSDKDFQMNGRFDQYRNTDGLTVVGQVGIAAGSDQIEVNKSGEVLVNGQALQAGDSVALADGGTVEMASDGNSVNVKSGEWATDIQFRNKGDGARAHLNIDVSTENALADGVRPHGLLGQTFDADDDARNGDAGKGTQGGGAIEGADGTITERGDRQSVQLYEVDNVHDRNFANFNHFIDDAGANPGAYDEQLMSLMLQSFSALAQSLMLMMTQSSGRRAGS